jgi:hypothetical protein
VDLPLAHWSALVPVHAPLSRGDPATDK